MTPKLTNMRRALPLVVVAALFACSSMFTTSIATIQEHPREYDGKTVTISGTVKHAANIFVVKYFIVDDGTASIPVITKRAVPATGERVKVTGRVDQAFALGDRSLLVIIEEIPDTH